MPVSTRSQLSSRKDEATKLPSSLLHNPHHRLKEKMKALTQFYEQHQNQLGRPRKTPMKENVVPPEERKLSFGGAEGKGLEARKLSFGGVEGKGLKARRASGIGGEKSSRIMVFVRLRPMSKKEREVESKSCVRIVDRRDVYLMEFAAETDYLRLKRVRGRHFTFDASFTDSAGQQEVYDTTSAEVVEGVLQGRNGTVFCYGATGAGKTYTMLGTMDSPGVMVLAIKDLFSKIRQRSHDGNHVVHLSYLEVYNETVRDLLSPGSPLLLREDKQGIVAAGLTQYKAYTTDQVMALLQQGNLNRTTEPTRVNETSSRSHAILQVIVEYKEKTTDNAIISRSGKLSLIDLAGSERALATDQRTLRSLEGANINRSLLALSSCINALVEGKKHIPYRNSKLTQLLKDSLGGVCNTVMIANISPSSLSFGETQNTLHWADRAKEIKTKESSMCEEVIMQESENENDQSKLLLELQKENSELRKQLAQLQHKLLSIQAQSLNPVQSPPPSTPMKCTPSSAQRRPKLSILSGNCFTPDSKKTATIQELQRVVKASEAEIQRLKKDHNAQIDKFKKEHAMLINQKDKLICELITKNNAKPAEGDLKVNRRRIVSPTPSTKKRSFWDSSAATSPSVVTVNGRKTRSHISRETDAAPSMLLQPGFARLRPNSMKF